MISATAGPTAGPTAGLALAASLPGPETAEKGG